MIGAGFLARRGSGGRSSRTGTVLVVLAGLVLSAVAPIAGASPASASDPRVLFRDGFSVTPDPVWTFYNRAGAVTGGKLLIDGDYLPGPRPRRDGWAMTHVGASTWTNYAFTATFDTRNVGGSPGEAHMATLYFRVRTSGATGDETFYRLDVWDPGQPDPTGQTAYLDHGLVALARYRHGVATQLADVRRSGTVTGVNTATITVVRGHVTACVNGHRVLSVTDPAPLLSGGVGVGQIWETNGAFDNVLVRRLPR